MSEQNTNGPAFGKWTASKPESGTASQMSEVSVYDDDAPVGAKLPAIVYGRTSAEAEARGLLISAAPDLLAAARKFIAFYDDLAKSNPGFMGKLCLQDYARWNEAMIELPAAIAKATRKPAEAQAGGAQ